MKKLKERAAVADAGGAIAEYFRTIQVGEGVQKRVTDRLLAGAIPLTETGDLDRKKLTEFTQAQVTDELAYLRSINPGLVRGMGGVATTEAAKPTKESKRALKEARKQEKQFLRESASHLGFRTKIGRRILEEGRSAFDPNFNARDLGIGGQAGGPSLPMEGI